MTDSGLRCTWCLADARIQAYHDDEWGLPVHDARALWEKLMPCA